ncbi:hypothetical protein JB92DRAFT_2832293 [Gautieria morchelliformis]|nr:hypothetical protein JB92DRAFT_2832293 [Gautieria morchelliformis]
MGQSQQKLEESRTRTSPWFGIGATRSSARSSSGRDGPFRVAREVVCTVRVLLARKVAREVWKGGGVLLCLSRVGLHGSVRLCLVLRYPPPLTLLFILSSHGSRLGFGIVKSMDDNVMWYLVHDSAAVCPSPLPPASLLRFPNQASGPYPTKTTRVNTFKIGVFAPAVLPVSVSAESTVLAVYLHHGKQKRPETTPTFSALGPGGRSISSYVPGDGWGLGAPRSERSATPTDKKCKQLLVQKIHNDASDPHRTTHSKSTGPPERVTTRYEPWSSNAKATDMNTGHGPRGAEGRTHGYGSREGGNVRRVGNCRMGNYKGRQVKTGMSRVETVTKMHRLHSRMISERWKMPVLRSANTEMPLHACASSAGGSRERWRAAKTKEGEREGSGRVGVFGDERWGLSSAGRMVCGQAKVTEVRLSVSDSSELGRQATPNKLNGSSTAVFNSLHRFRVTISRRCSIHRTVVRDRQPGEGCTSDELSMSCLSMVSTIHVLRKPPSVFLTDQGTGSQQYTDPYIIYRVMRHRALPGAENRKMVGFEDLSKRVLLGICGLACELRGFCFLS